MNAKGSFLWPLVFNVKIENHKLLGAKWRPSTNYNERPSLDISMLVIHNISLPPNEFGGPYIEDFFCNELDCTVHPYFQEIKDMQVSAHLLIRRDGEVVQFVPFNKRAWHAGRSEFNGETECNDFSIGIELEGADEIPFDETQYQVLTQVTQAIMQAYPQIEVARIVGHSDIAPGRKSDPGRCFNWPKYKDTLR